MNSLLKRTPNIIYLHKTYNLAENEQKMKNYFVGHHVCFNQLCW